MKFLVTGGGGFIGRAFVHQAAKAGHQVALLARRGGDFPSGSVVFTGDLRSDLHDLMRGFAPDACVHFAWTTTPGAYLTSAENAGLAQDTLALAARLYELGLPHFIAAGTCLEYEPSDAPLGEGAPRSRYPSPYAAAKMAVHDGLAASYPDFSWAWLRVFYPYGRGDHPARLPGQLRRSGETGIPLELSRPFDVVDYIHVEDVAAAFLLVAECKLAGAFNVGSGSPVTVGEFASLFASAGGIPRPVHRPVGEKISRYADTGKLRACGWMPVREMSSSLPEIARA